MSEKIKKENVINKYRTELKKMVSEDDFVRNFGLDVRNKILKYSQLEIFNTIDELIPEQDDYRILLLESEPSVGHWVCLIRKGDILEFFDSYGKTHKGELKYIPKFINRMLNQPDDYLTKIMKSSKKPIFSTLKLQNNNPNICTCGRHVIARILCSKAGYNLDDYEKLIKRETTNREMPPDILICHWVPVK
jgi:hypothetical protein